jgi:hypothetical protein
MLILMKICEDLTTSGKKFKMMKKNKTIKRSIVDDIIHLMEFLLII